MFDWSAFLNVARRLAQDTNDEAALRSALSRAYYAALGIAYRRLLGHGWQRPRGSLHLYVWRTYQNSSTPVCRRLGELGFILRDRRNDADYENPFPGDLEHEVSLALLRAEDLLVLLARLDAREACI